MYACSMSGVHARAISGDIQHRGPAVRRVRVAATRRDVPTTPQGASRTETDAAVVPDAIEEVIGDAVSRYEKSASGEWELVGEPQSTASGRSADFIKGERSAISRGIGQQAL